MYLVTSRGPTLISTVIAADGLVGCNARLWARDGRLLASGTSKHTCRPNPRYEEEVAQAKELGLIR